MLIPSPERLARSMSAAVVGLLLVTGACAAPTGPASTAGSPATAATPPGADGTGPEPLPATTAPAPATTPVPTPAPTAAVDAVIAEMSIDEKVCQLFMVLAYGPTATSAGPAQQEANQTYLGAPTAAEAIERCAVGGVLYLARNTLDPARRTVDTGNFANPTQMVETSSSLQAIATSTHQGIPLLIAADQEGGLVTRVGEPLTTFAGNMSLGAGGSAAGTSDAARVMGEEMRAVGINTNFAPVADVNVNPANPVIGVRSFGADPEAVSTLTGAAVDGYQSAGVAATVKHFPGHGDTTVDSHVGLPVIAHDAATLEATDLRPFRAAIAADADLIMTGHLSVPQVDPSGDPATISAPIVTGLLRGELGYDGVVVTDSLWMAGVRARFGDDDIAVRALLAGSDLLLTPPDLQSAKAAILQAVRDGVLTEPRIDESVRRILLLKERQGLVNGTPPATPPLDGTVGTVEHRALADRLALDGATLLEANCARFPLANGPGVVVVSDGTAAGDTLARALGDAGLPASVVALGSGSSTIVGRACTAGAAVVVTRDVVPGDAQQQAVSALQAAGVATIVVSTGAPYDAGLLPAVDAFIAVYDPGAAAMRAASTVITGRGAAGGRLPVRVPARGGPEFAIGAQAGPCA